MFADAHLAEQTRSCSSVVGGKTLNASALRAASAWSGMRVWKRVRREHESPVDANGLDIGMKRNHLRRATGGFGKETTEDRGQAWGEISLEKSVTANFKNLKSGAKQVFFFHSLGRIYFLWFYIFAGATICAVCKKLFSLAFVFG